MSSRQVDRTVQRITVDGKSWDLAVPDITIGLIKECRRVVGRPPMAIVSEMAAGQGDLDTLAALVWLARRQAGERITLEAVESTLTYGTLVEIETVSEQVGVDDPE